MKEQSLKPVIEKLEQYFELFNKKFFGGKLSKPIITVSPDTTRGAYGWCTSWKAWTDKELDQAVDFSKVAEEELEKMKKEEGFYEINMCAEYLARPFEQTAETLLHEMVHLLNLQKNVQDTSRGGKYHNNKFKEAAEAHGLVVEKDAKYGWCHTKLNDEAIEFVDSLNDKKFDLYRKVVPKFSKAASKQSSRKYVCPCCGLVIRATKVVRVSCMDCDQEMQAAI